MKWLSFLFKGEVLFSGFLFSSVFKSNFSFIPIDLTLVFMVLTIFVGIKRLFEQPFILKKASLPITIYLILTIFMMVSLIYTLGESYAYTKVFSFATLTLWSFAGVFILIKNKESLDLFTKGLLFYGSITIMTVFINYMIGNTSDFRVGVGAEGAGNVLGLGRLTGVVSIILIISLFHKKRSIKSKVIVISLIGISMFILLLTGSRMPFIALIGSLLLIVFLSVRIEKGDVKIKRGFLLSIPLIPIAYFLLKPLIQDSNMVYRISKLFEDGGGGSVQSRTSMIKGSIEMWKGSPILGNGIGSFPVYYTGMDNKNRLYPHNIFTEFLSELGLIGLSLFLLLIIISLFSAFETMRGQANYLQISVVIITLFLIFNANSSGDFNDNRWLFSFIGLSIMLPLYKNNE